MPRLHPTRSHIPDFATLARRVRATATKTLFKEVEAYAEQERDRFVRKIENQAFPSFKEVFYPESGTNLSPDWLARKERKGADERTMIATTWYKSNIKVWTRKGRRKGERTIVRVGFHDRVLARDLDNHITDTPLWLVATYNEHGSNDGNLPARPHWRPHFDQMRAEAKRTRKRLREKIRAALAKDTKLIGKIVVT